MINHETRLPYAKSDQSEMRIRQSQHVHTPGWRGAWIWCLRHRDDDAANLIFDRNRVSDECDEGDHDECFFSWCRCDHHSSVQFTREHKPLLSLREVQSTREEAA